MGFSVSGSAAVVFVGLFLAFGMYHSATANSFERVSDAEQARSDDLLASRNTAITVATASYDATTDELTVEVDNAGTTQLRVSNTDLLGARLTVTLTGVASQPDHVKVVTGTSVSATAEVTAA